MNRRLMKSWFQAVVALVLAAFAVLARADGASPLELGVASGYTRGHGPAAGGMMPELRELAGDVLGAPKPR